jgi:bifunctional UDP-N-acetylglucosamine pyrophosphorylase/glucosamine-1-phosphate N-acetyltransferase
VPTKRRALNVLVLAAGQGKRLRSKTIKLLHPVAGRPMVAHVLDAAQALRPQRLVTVVGHQAEQVRAALDDGPTEFVLQREQLGTGHAVLQAARRISGSSGSTLLILNGDLPTLRASTLRKLINRHRRSGAALSVLTAEVKDPAGYGRIVRDTRGGLTRIVEHGDATASERRIPEINCGLYCADPAALLRALRRVRPDNAQGEYYITDAVHELLARGKKVIAVRHDDAEEILGVNTRQELAQASRTLFARKAADLQERGVTLLDAERTWIDPRARIGRDTIVYPDVIVEGPTVIGEDCVIRSGCRLTDSRLERGVEVRDHSVVLESRVGNGAKIGPFAHLRPGSVLEADCHVGNFVELKKTRLGRTSKANHLAYLGDATIGPGCNIGAGTITCNYDGKYKHPTILGRDVFIGSDTQLVAPVKVDDGSYVAAGSTVTQDVPSGALAISRSRQRNVEGWVKRRAGGSKGKSKRKKG